MLRIIIYFSGIPLLVVEQFLQKQFKAEAQYENILRGSSFSEGRDDPNEVSIPLGSRHYHKSSRALQDGFWNLCSTAMYCCLKQPLTLYTANFHYFAPRKVRPRIPVSVGVGYFFLFSSRPHIAIFTVLGPQLDFIQYLGLPSISWSFQRSYCQD